MADTLSPAVEEPRAPTPTLEQRKAYCRTLCRVILRYADDTDTEQLAVALREIASGITSRRPCQGLNDAAYAAFAHYLLA